MTDQSWLKKTFAQENWTPEKRQYVQDQLDKGRRIPDIARELLVPPGQLRTAMRYYRDKTGQTQTFVPIGPAKRDNYE
jgi:transposase-like protein